MSVRLQKLASIQPRTNPVKFARSAIGEASRRCQQTLDPEGRQLAPRPAAGQALGQLRPLLSMGNIDTSGVCTGIQKTQTLVGPFSAVSKPLFGN